jgi:hypothetical protein
MKKIAMLVIMGGILLILSLDASAGITYPRNRVSISDTRLNAHPWDDPFASNTGVRVSTISRPSDSKNDPDSQPTVKNLSFTGPLFVGIVVTYWNLITSDYGTNREPIVIIKD